MPVIPQFEMAVRMRVVCPSMERLSFNSPNPINNKANPMKQSAKLWILSFLKYFKIKPRPKSGMAADAMEKLNPKKDTIQAVIVVPMFAPKITPMACSSVSISAFTKLTTITVVAPLD